MKISTFKVYVENLHNIDYICSRLPDNVDDESFKVYYDKSHQHF